MSEGDDFTDFFAKIDSKKGKKKTTKTAAKEKTEEQAKSESSGWVEETVAQDAEAPRQILAGSRTVITTAVTPQEQAAQEAKKSDKKWGGSSAADQAAVLKETDFPKLSGEPLPKPAAPEPDMQKKSWANSRLRRDPVAAQAPTLNKKGPESWYEETSKKAPVSSSSNIYSHLGESNE
eukprot:TRINITY_DN9130_c0_g1_i1.p1 TRINITY_DN9130_c0_g1~~TRINITY_DN9130_c0_g1_i1.p1  ORF type:complete len:178 (+),score=49.97 TRINITY_DN9130_c0_g1_i1:65-598(+)